MTVMPIFIGTFGTVTKRLLQGLEDIEIRGRVEKNFQRSKIMEKN